MFFALCSHIPKPHLQNQSPREYFGEDQEILTQFNLNVEEFPILVVTEMNHPSVLHASQKHCSLNVSISPWTMDAKPQFFCATSSKVCEFGAWLIILQTMFNQSTVLLMVPQLDWL